MPENTVFDLTQICFDDPVLSRLSDLLDSLVVQAISDDCLPFPDIAPVCEWLDGA